MILFDWKDQPFALDIHIYTISDIYTISGSLLV